MPKLRSGTRVFGVLVLWRVSTDAGVADSIVVSNHRAARRPAADAAARQRRGCRTLQVRRRLADDTGPADRAARGEGAAMSDQAACDGCSGTGKDENNAICKSCHGKGRIDVSGGK